MEEQNKQQNEATLFSLLESANLLDYYERFIEQGGDDVDQLCEATEEEFKEITKLVGMQTKPLHIRRLQKSLVEWKKRSQTCKKLSVGTSWMDKWNSTQTTQTSSGITITKPTTTTITITGSPCMVSEQSSATQKKRGRPPLNKAAKKVKSGVFELKLPPMEAIIDWESLDDERKQLIREHSRIYGRDTKKRKTHTLNGHEQMINEAAAQLCLRDPTLLVRRDELFTQARRIVRDSGFSFVHGHSRSKYIGESPTEDEGSASGGAVPPSKLKRQERIQEIDQLLESHKQRQEVLVQRKKQLENENMATNDIQQEVSNLQREIMSLQTEQKELQKRQRRSERYYHTKENRKKSSGDLSVESDIHLESIEGVAEQDPSEVVEILQQNADDNRLRDEQPSDEDQCVRNLFTIVPQHLPEGIHGDSVNAQALRASILSGAPVGSTINALLSLSNEDKNNAHNIQALQNVLSQISLPHLVSNAIGSAPQHLVTQVITTTSQDHNTTLVHDPQTVHYVQPSIAIVPHHLVNTSTGTQHIVETSQEHAPVTTQILQEAPNIVQYSQQSTVPIIQNLIECETQQRM